MTHQQQMPFVTEGLFRPEVPAEKPRELPEQIALQVQAEFNRLALLELASGKNWIGAKAIGEDVRRWSRVHCHGKFKVNNNQITAMSLEAERMFPALRGKFKHRKPKG